MGLLVDEVTRNGPADREGIRPGDLLLRLDGATVPTLTEAGLVLEGLRPRERVAVEGLRLRGDPRAPFLWLTELTAERAR